MKLCRYHTNQHRKQEIIKPTTPPPPMAPQVVVMTTHGTTRDEKAANPTIPCSQWEKETNTTIIWQRKYQSIKTNYIKMSCTFQWCMYHSKIGCKYLANRAPNTKGRQADNPTGGTAICRMTDHDATFQWGNYLSIIVCEYLVSLVLKTKGHQADNTAVTGSTVSCNDNAR